MQVLDKILHPSFAAKVRGRLSFRSRLDPSSPTSPLVSIVMPAHNAAETIECALDSIRGQSYIRWELTVVDDHSTDLTTSIVTDYARIDDRITLIANRRKGVSSARNTGISASTGELIAFLDADDCYFDNAIVDRVRYLVDNPNCDAVFCPAELVDEDLRTLNWTLGGRPVVRFPDMYQCPFHINSVMLRTNLLDASAFDESFSNGEDWLLWQRLARTGVEFRRVDTCKVAYRQRPQSTVLGNYLQHEETLARVLATVYARDPDCPNPDPRYEQGLNEPSKEVVALKRKFQLLTHLLLDGDVENAREIATTFRPSVWREVPMHDIANTVKFAVMRYFICTSDEWPLYWRRKSHIVTSFLQTSFPAQSYPNLAARVCEAVETLGQPRRVRLVRYYLRRPKYLCWKTLELLRN